MGSWSNFFYKPLLGAKGNTEYTLFDTGLASADAELTSSKSHRLLTSSAHGLVFTGPGAGGGLDSDKLDTLHAVSFPLLAGRAGGQTLYGGTGSGENLTLYSTSYTTKGKVKFGVTDYFYFDEAQNKFKIIRTLTGASPDKMGPWEGYVEDNSTLVAADQVFGIYQSMLSLSNAGHSFAIGGQAICRRNSGEHAGIYGAGGADDVNVSTLAGVWGGDFHAYSTSAVSGEPFKRAVEAGVHNRKADCSESIGVYIQNIKNWPDGLTNNYRAGVAIKILGTKYDDTAGWEVGLSLEQALFANEAAIKLASTHRIYWIGVTSPYLYRSGDTLVASNGFGVATGMTYQVAGTQVVGARVIDARCDDVVDATYGAEEAGVLDALRDAMIAHGLIAAA